MSLDKRSVRTEQPDDVQIQIADGTTPTQLAEVDTDGRLHVYEERDASDPLPVEIIQEGPGLTHFADYAATASLAAQASETVQGSLVSNATTGRLRGVTVSCEVPFKAEIRKDDGVSPVTIAVLYGEAGASVQWEPKAKKSDLNELAGDGASTRYDVVFTNNGTAAIGPSGVGHVTIEYEEEA